MIVLSAIAVVLGSISQRVAGLGFALLVAPIFVLTFGPYGGVVLINFAGTISSILVLLRLRKNIDWNKYLLLGPPAALAIIPTSFIVVYFNGPVLQIVIGMILLIGLAVALSNPPAEQREPKWWHTVLTGAAAGITSATAGVGAPPMGIYAAATGWKHQDFSATLQPVFVTTGAVSFISKVVIAGGVPSFDPSIWIGVIALSGIGLAIGEWVRPFISAETARVIALGLCLAGAFAATVDGGVSLLIPAQQLG